MADHSTTTPNRAGVRAFVARRPMTAFLIMPLGSPIRSWGWSPLLFIG
jgi:hypothetical protein